MSPAIALSLALLASAAPPPAPAPAVQPDVALPGAEFPAPADGTQRIFLDLGPARTTPAPAAGAPPVPRRLTAAAWSAFCARAEGAAVVSRNGDFLGRIAAPRAPDSVFNPRGSYGGRASPASIWNAAGPFGGTRGRHSPFSRTGTPPLVVAGGRTIAVLTDDPAQPAGVVPWQIALMCYGTDEFLHHDPEPGR